MVFLWEPSKNDALISELLILKWGEHASICRCGVARWIGRCKWASSKRIILIWVLEFHARKEYEDQQQQQNELLKGRSLAWQSFLGIQSIVMKCSSIDQAENPRNTLKTESPRSCNFLCRVRVNNNTLGIRLWTYQDRIDMKYCLCCKIQMD